MENQNRQPNTDLGSDTISIQSGSCHCGTIRFEARLDLSKPVSRCNCSICTKLGKTGGIVKPEAFRLLSGSESLGSYQWGAKIGSHNFCRQCGVHVYTHGHLAEVGGDFVSVNFNCLDAVDVNELTVLHWDGRHDNWDAGPRPTPWPRFAAPTSAAEPQLVQTAA